MYVRKEVGVHVRSLVRMFVCFGHGRSIIIFLYYIFSVVRACII